VPISPTGGSPTGDGPSGPRRPRRARHLAGHRRTLALAAAGLVAAVALLALVALPDSDQEGDLSTDSGPGTTAITEPAPSTEATTGTTGTTGTTPGTDRATPVPPDGECAVGADGTVAGDSLPDGRPWAYRVTGTLPAAEAQVLVDGAAVRAGSLGATRQQAALAEDRLTWGNAVPVGGGEVSDFVLPAGAARVEASVWDGSRRTTVELCAKAVPGIDELRYAALFVPAGSEVVAVVADDADGVPVAHSDFVFVPGEGGPDAMAEVASGDLSAGPWSLRAGGDADLVTVSLTLPGTEPTAGDGAAGAAVRSRPDALRTTWYASSVVDGGDGRYFLWGFTADDVATVELTMFDGEVVTVDTRPSGVAGAGGRVFVTEFPAGAGIRLVEGTRSDGSVAVELRDPEAGAIGNGMGEQANARVPMRER
jgi:hypothetical protein